MSLEILLVLVVQWNSFIIGVGGLTDSPSHGIISISFPLLEEEVLLSFWCVVSHGIVLIFILL